jgi:hypothetical protein
MFAAITRNEVRVEAVALLSMLFFFSLFVFEEEDSIFVLHRRGKQVPVRAAGGSAFFSNTYSTGFTVHIPL